MGCVDSAPECFTEGKGTIPSQSDPELSSQTLCSSNYNETCLGETQELILVLKQLGKMVLLCVISQLFMVP